MKEWVAIAWMAGAILALGDPPQVITGAGMAENNLFQLEWPADTGWLYRVETTTDLNDPAVWSNTTPGGLVFSSVDGFCLLLEDGPQRYYRFVGRDSAITSLYMVVDLSAGPDSANYPISYLGAVPDGGWSDEYKTTKLVLRRIMAGTFTMGSPTNELGRDLYESPHVVTLTKDVYIGVFEVTQKQWERVMGNWPSYFSNVTYREARPVEHVSYYEIRENPLPETDYLHKGSAISPNWPQSDQVHADSFMGRLQAKTGLAFNLPTEAQWEYACRSGTTNALNSGFDLTNTSADVHMDAVGRYWNNGGSGYSSTGTTAVGTAKVGSYQPSPWGLYDMHGNVGEWSLNWFETSPTGALDPPGPEGYSFRVVRGGGCFDDAMDCRSADRFAIVPPAWRGDYLGFRLSLTLP